MSDNCDIAILGGGHNGLVCAWYLARSGRSVTVVEKNPVVGGAAVTEEFHPGFRNSVASYTVSLLNPKVISDMELSRHGLQLVERPAANFWPVEGRSKDGLLLPNTLQGRQEAMARFSANDARNLPAYEAALEKAANLLRQLLLETPPTAGGGLGDLIKGFRLGKSVIDCSLEEQQTLVDLFTNSVAGFLDHWFEHDRVKAALAFDGIVGTLASPHTPGTAYVLLHHCFGELNGKRGIWGHALGGMGAITQAMAAAATEAGVRIMTHSTVSEVLHDNSRVMALKLASGECLQARAVAVNIPPKLLFRDYLPGLANTRPAPARFRQIASGSGTFRMNVALSELPDFTCQPGIQQQLHHGAGIIIGPTVDYLERAYLSARAKGWSEEPVIEMVIPSTIDPGLAPKGKHVASLFVQHVLPQLPAGRSWKQAHEKEAFSRRVIETVTRYAPNFRSSVLATQTLSPLDLEQRFGLVDGDIFHGQLGPGQLFSLRPVLGAADYRLPLKGLYLCGAGAHPGGGVTGLPGHNAAREIIRDWKKLAK
jgi:phytoene dehydrogenase-like protein